MILAEVTLGARHWLGGVVLLLVVALVVVVWSYRRGGSRSWVRGLAAVLKGIGIVALAVCLVEPLFTGTRPRPGSNLFLVVADNSRSLQLSDSGERQSRGQAMKEGLAEESSWLTRLAQDFDVRRYVFDTNVRPAKTFAELTLDGESSAINGTLIALTDRYRGQPVAGILLLTDGNGTDLSDVAMDDKQKLPPVYPVAIGTDHGLVDLSVSQVAVSQTNFEAAPVTITATLEGRSVANKEVGLRVLNEAGEEVERRKVERLLDGEPTVQRFLLKPEKSGISFFTVQAFLNGEEKANESQEATLANNRRIVTVDRGGGPFRVLYVGGRPNWEFKFLRRALDEDDEVKLVGMVRIAKKEPKFAFLNRGERTNPLFKGFGNKDEQAENYDQPVLIRLGTKDADELRGGFPKNSDDLFQYHAIVLDDIEAAFFTQDQLSLLQQFVSRRGGGLLMLGGNQSFGEGGYQRTAVGDMLPVYLDRGDLHTAGEGYRLLLSREGWLQPWVRLRTNESDESKRLTSMPEFKSLNGVQAIKPGASVLAQVTSAEGKESPALVVQPFGRGRTAALLVGDLWRWNLKRTDHSESDLEKSWRQTVRWLVSDVPGRVEVESRRSSTGSTPAVQVLVRARDAQFEPLDNANVALHVQTPDGHKIELVAESSDRSPGQYEALFAPRAPGVYRATITVTAADSSEVGQREIGWTVEPQTEEFRTLAVNRPLLDQLAKQTGGEVISADGLDQFVSSLPNRKIPVTETWTYPLWHQSSVFLLAISCLIGEWGLRRWRGMP
ncbi:MAG: glutamine amidotransferase [Planctomycetaceae bacterium]